MTIVPFLFSFFFFNDTATTEIYTLSLHDALPIWDHPGEPDDSHRGVSAGAGRVGKGQSRGDPSGDPDGSPRDRKSTRLNSSHDQISYAVFCLKKKKR